MRKYLFGLLIALALLIGLGGYYVLSPLRQYQAQAAWGGLLLMMAKDDHARAAAHSQRGAGLGEKARYLRAFKRIDAAGYRALFGQAMQDHDAAVKLDSANAEPLVARGTTKYFRGAIGEKDGFDGDAEMAAWLAGARDDFSAAIALAPNHVTALDMRGLIAEGQRDFDAAIEDYTRVSALDARLGGLRLAQTHCERGGLRQRARDFAAAAADYRRAIELGADADGCSCDPYAPLAGTYLQAGRYDEAWNAIARARQARRWVPDELIVELKKASGRDR